MSSSLQDRLRSLSPRQLEVYVLGTLKSQAQRGVFYFSMYNFAQILFISFENGAFGGIFESFWVYLAAHILAFLAIIAIDFVAILPGEKDYQKRQDYLRDPLREDVRELHEEVKQLREERDSDE